MSEEINLNINKQEPPQNAIICISKLKTIEDLVKENSNDKRFQNNDDNNHIMSIITTLQERITNTNYKITASTVFSKISKKLDSLETNIKTFLTSKTTEITEIKYTLDELLEELPFLQTLQSENLSLDKTNSFLSQINSAALEIKDNKTLAQMI